jgi:hypothetical protein
LREQKSENLAEKPWGPNSKKTEEKTKRQFSD